MLKNCISKYLTRNLAKLKKKGRSNNKEATLTPLVMPLINRGERDATTRWETLWLEISKIIVFKAMLTMSCHCSLHSTIYCSMCFPFQKLCPHLLYLPMGQGWKSRKRIHQSIIKYIPRNINVTSWR